MLLRHATLARLACCSERTVGRALVWLRMFGFLSWQRRLTRVPSRLGSIVRQTSNAYAIALSGLASIAAGMLGNRPGRHNCRPSQLHQTPPSVFRLEAAE